MSKKSCGTCHYFDPIFSPLQGWCQYYKVHPKDLIYTPQWVRTADRSVWGNHDGKKCVTWKKKHDKENPHDQP